jgi:hypothetical protein
MFTLKDALWFVNEVGINLDNFSIKDLLVGLNIELEHGTVNPFTNVTNDDLLITGKIALAHLNEYPNYYNEEYGLPAMERELKRRLNDKNT